MGEVIAFRPRVVPAVDAGSDERTLIGPVRREPLAPAPPSRPDSPAVDRETVATTSSGTHERQVGRREPLWREVAGRVLREERHRQRRTLAQVAQRAGMSVQYLSELERGRKEASSEMLAAACGALGMNLAEFAGRSASLLHITQPGGSVLLAA
jgi:Helix-turn-helix domain